MAPSLFPWILIHTHIYLAILSGLFSKMQSSFYKFLLSKYMILLFSIFGSRETLKAIPQVYSRSKLCRAYSYSFLYIDCFAGEILPYGEPTSQGTAKNLCPLDRQIRFQVSFFSSNARKGIRYKFLLLLGLRTSG